MSLLIDVLVVFGDQEARYERCEDANSQRSIEADLDIRQLRCQYPICMREAYSWVSLGVKPFTVKQLVQARKPNELLYKK